MLLCEMKSARHIARVASGVLLCLLALASAARAVENPPPDAPDLAMTAEKTPPPAIVLALQKATDGLQMPSETDAPFKVIYFEREAGAKAASVEELAQLAGAPADSKIETRDLSEFFEVAATIEDWMNEDEKATAQRFADLLEILKTQLKDAQVLVWGDAEKTVAILGEAEGGLAGVTTLVVET